MQHVNMLVYISLLLFCTGVGANPSISVGVGAQYAGFIGFQLAQVKDNHKFRGSLGLVGVSAGYEYSVSSRVTLGGSVFRYHDYSDDLSGFAVSANYYFTPVDQNGFMFGLDVLQQKARNSTRIESNDDTVVFFSAGYRF